MIEVCGVRFSGTADPLDGLVYQELVDWDGVPDARGGGDPVPSANGVFPRSVGLRESRLISVKAAISVGSDAEFFEAKRRVESMPFAGEMRVDQGDGVWVRDVEVEQVSIPDAHAVGYVEFTIDVVAPDPVRYRDWVTLGPVGVPTRSGGLVLPSEFPWDFGEEVRAIVAVDNAGRVPVLPRVKVSGSADAVVVHGGPRRLEFGPFVGELVFDSLSRRAWLNGSDVTRQLVRRDWHSVPAGQSQDFFFTATDPSPDMSMTVEYRIGAW